MSIEQDSRYTESYIEELNTWVDDIHSELQNPGAPSYPSTSVDVMTDQDRRDIGEHLCREFGLDFPSSLSVIEQVGVVYREDEDRYLVTDKLLDSESYSDGRELLSHDAGHRFGRKVINHRLIPVKKMCDISQEGFETLLDYFVSENFAERVKVASGNTFDQDFTYNLDFIEDPPEGYERRGRIGPEELVDPTRDEDIEELVASVDTLVNDLATGVSEWN